MSQSVNNQALVIPSGIQIQAEGDAFNIGNQGDVVLRGQVSFPLRRLFSENGSIVLESQEPLTLTRVEAPNGDIRLKGNLTVQTLVAKRVAFLGGNLTVRQVVAQEEVYLSGDTLQADMVLAPRVDIDARLRGRATVLESKNDIGPNMLKGGFRLDEYLEIFPSGRELLEQYPDVKARLEGWPEVAVPGESTLLADMKAQEAGATAPAAPKAADAASSRRRETSNEPIEISSAELEGDNSSAHEKEETGNWTEAAAPLVAKAGVSIDELYQHLSDSFLRIIGSYSDIRLPPPLATLEVLIEERQFDAMKEQLTGLWNDLLKYHKKEGLQIASTVTQNIQEMRRQLARL